MDSLSDVNRIVSVVGKCIFHSNHDKSFLLTIESLNLFFSCYDEYQTVVIFNGVYCSVRCVNTKLKTKCVQKL